MTVGRQRAGAGEGLLVLAGGTLGAVGLSAVGVPAGGIIGAVLGSGAVSMARDSSVQTRTLRVPGLVLLGVAAGLRLGQHTLAQLFDLAVPLGTSIVVLLLVQYLLALLLVRRFGVDPVTALLTTAPGGVSEMAVLADEFGARVGLVTAIHVVRVILVVVVALPILLHVLA